MQRLRLPVIPVLIGVFSFSPLFTAPGHAQSAADAIAAAVRPLPEDLREGATVFRYDAATGHRELLRGGTNLVECTPPDDSGFTRCYPRSSAAYRDLRAKLSSEGMEGEALSKALAEAVDRGEVKAAPFGSIFYRLYDNDDRIQLLWVILLPNATSADLAMPTASSRDGALAGRGTPWMMNEGMPGAHLMIPINGTELSNAGTPAELMDTEAVTDPVEQALLPLPADLRSGATVSTFDAATGERTVLREGTNELECRPRDPETGFTRCYHRSVWAGRDMAGRLQAEGRSQEQVAEAMAEARADGRIPETAFASLGYRLYEQDDRLRLLWILRLPGATSEELGLPTGSQRDASLAGRGMPWMMNEGTPGAHLMIPINGTALSNR
jgi:hypothetical protein